MHMKKWSQFFHGKRILLFIVAFFFGMSAKHAADLYVRNGFNDPSTVISRGSLYNIDEAEQRMITKNISQNTQ